MNKRKIAYSLFTIMTMIVITMQVPAQHITTIQTPTENHQIEYTITFSEQDLIIQKHHGYDLIELQDGATLHQPGYPAIPYKDIHIALPPNTQIHTVTTRQKQSKTLEETYTLLPSQLPQPTTYINQPKNAPIHTLYTLLAQKKYHTHQTSYPTKNVEFLQQSDLAGQGIATLRLYPLTYHPRTNTLILHTKLTFTMKGTYTTTYGDFLPKQSTPRLKQTYTETLKRMVINPEDIQLQTNSQTKPQPLLPAGGPYDHVIIGTSSAENDWQPLITWHTKRGLKDTYITTDYIYTNYAGSDDQEKIRNFIKDAHATWGTTYYLLAGEHGSVPFEYRNYYANAPSDQYYSDYDDDWVMEVFVGRCTAEGSTQIDTFIDKVLTYEKNPPLSNYILDITLIGMDANSETYCEILKDEIDSFIPSRFSVTKVYDSQARNHETDAKNAHNDGQNLINHADHAGVSYLGTGDRNHGWGISSSEVDAFTNTNRLCIVTSLGCDPNSLDSSDCIAEHYVIYNPNEAGVGFNGNTRHGYFYSGDNYPPYDLSNGIDYEWWRSLFVHDKYILGETIADCKHSYSQGSGGVSAHCEWEFILTGEPAMPIWTQTPSSLQVTHPSELPVGSSTFTVHVESSSVPVQDAYVCLWKDGEVYLTEYTDSNGDATFNPNPSTQGTMYVTTTKRHYLPDESSSLVTASDTFVLDGECFYDDAKTQPVDPVNVLIQNLDTGEQWPATTTGNAYELELTPDEDVSAGDTLRYFATDDGHYINVTDREITQSDIDSGGITLDLILKEYYTDLTDFPYYPTEDHSSAGRTMEEMTGPACLEMATDYMHWNTTTDPGTTPPRYTQSNLGDQLWIYNEARSLQTNTDHSFVSARGMQQYLQNYMPQPYGDYGYNFNIKYTGCPWNENWTQDSILGAICIWTDYSTSYAHGNGTDDVALKPGHKPHVPAFIPGYGGYDHWMAIRGIHTDVKPWIFDTPHAAAVDETNADSHANTINVLGFWVNDPLSTGIGENTYKTGDEFKNTYFTPLAQTGDPYDGEYVAVVEPPKDYTEQVMPEMNTVCWPQPLQGNPTTKDVFGIHSSARIIKAAVDSIQQLLTLNSDLNEVFEQSYPQVPLKVETLDDSSENYYLVPFSLTPSSWRPRGRSEAIDSTTVVVLVDAETGQFKELSWVTTPTNYLKIRISEAVQLVYTHLLSLGHTRIDTKTFTETYIYRGHSPFYPDILVTTPFGSFIVTQENTLLNY